MTVRSRPQYIWEPQPGPQTDAITATFVDIMLYGGARGGGKTDFLLGDYLQDVPKYRENWKGILIRRSYPALEEVIARSQEIYPKTGAVWAEGKRQWTFPEGGVLKFRHLDSPLDLGQYLGHQYPWIAWDQAEQWPTDYCFRAMLGCLRCAAADIPTKRVRLTANPGGIGHHWLKELFRIAHYPRGFRELRDEISKLSLMYIPARVTDNKLLAVRDPHYVDVLKGVGSEALVRAWLDGDWDAVLGAFFDCWDSELHEVDDFDVPLDWPRFAAYDHGSARPFSFGMYAISDGSMPEFPNDAIVKYDEIYGAKGPNVGLKLSVPEIADRIHSRCRVNKFTRMVADPAIWAHTRGPSIAEEFRDEKIFFTPADNNRRAGASQMRDRLVGRDGRPMLYFCSRCRDSIRTIPLIQHSIRDMEDVDSDGEDHAYDETRYMVMSRPWIPTRHARPMPKDMHTMTINELYAEQERRERRSS